jgi:putative addiction module killer protein
MEALPIRIEEYVLPEGRKPFSDWLDGMDDRKAKGIIDSRVRRLRTGNFGDCKALESIFELRIDYGPGYRIYCGKKNHTCVLLLAGGSKKTQDSDIKTAKHYWSEYKKRTSR